MPYTRSASGRHTIDIYEDLSHNDLEANEDADPPEHQLYIPVAEYKYDENDMLNKLAALEALSQSIHSAVPSDISLSRSASIRIKEDDPFVNQEEDDDGITEVDEDYAPSQLNGASTRDPRKSSETYSEMPSELEMPGTYAPSPAPETYLTPIAQRRIRQRSSHSSQLFSSPHDDNQPLFIAHRILSSPRTPTSERQRSSAFRNPSSVRAIQMSSPSPSPFPHSPRSARHRASISSRNGTPLRSVRSESQSSCLRDATPTRSSLPQHPNPLKEYPLILLHCTVAPIILPYSQAILQAVLPGFVLEDMLLLREKLTSNILERGLLISHPGEDYELLEERVLESLELKKPRVGKCGHFHGPEQEEDNSTVTYPSNLTNMNPESCENTPHTLSATDPTCLTCTNRIANPHCTTDTSTCAPDEIPRRWDLKVYAANGLLRAGAWTAAWREMEKVDLEIGVWIPDDMRRALEHESEEERILERQRFMKSSESSTPGATQQMLWGVEEEDEKEVFMREETRATRPVNSRNVSTSTNASTAPLAQHIKSSQHTTTTTTKSKRHPQHPRLPLSTLFLRYIQRQLTRRPQITGAVLAILLGISFLLFQRNAPAGSTNIMDYASHLSHDFLVAPLSKKAESMLSSSTNTQSMRIHNHNHDFATPTPLPACTFPAHDAAAKGMTALPEDLASSVLSVLAVASASSSASPSATDILATAASTAATSITSIIDAAAETATSVLEGALGMLEKVGRVVGPGDGDEGAGLGDVLDD